MCALAAADAMSRRAAGCSVSGGLARAVNQMWCRFSAWRKLGAARRNGHVSFAGSSCCLHSCATLSVPRCCPFCRCRGALCTVRDADIKFVLPGGAAFTSADLGAVAQQAEREAQQADLLEVAWSLASGDGE